jgi:hypothetical protein
MSGRRGGRGRAHNRGYGRGGGGRQGGRAEYNRGGYDREPQPYTVAVARFDGFTPTVGAVLTCKPSRGVSIEAIGEFVDKIHNYARRTYKSKITEIFGEDRQINEYHDYDEDRQALADNAPQQPAADAGGQAWMEYETWKSNVKQLQKDIHLEEEEKKQLFAVMIGQMSDEVIHRLKMTDEGLEAVNGQDPRVLLEQVFSGLMNDERVTPENNLVNRMRQFQNISMRPDEDIVSFRKRFGLYLSAVRYAIVGAGQDPEQRMATDHEQAIMFIKGLHDAQFDEFKRMYENTQKEYPENFRDAAAEATRFIPKNQSRVARAYNFVARADNPRNNQGNNAYGKEDGGKRYEIKLPDGTSYFPAPNQCSNPDCRQMGHYVRDCPLKKGSSSDDIERAVASERNKTGGGRGVTFNPAAIAGGGPASSSRSGGN